MGETNPIIRWNMAKEKGTLRIWLRTEEVVKETCYPAPRYYRIQMMNEMRNFEPYNAVEIYINSRGGDFRSAMGIYDALKKIRPWIPVRTLILGTCASAATLFLGLRGPKYITPEGRIFVHLGTATLQKEDGTEEETREALSVEAAADILADAYRKAMRDNLPRREYRKSRELPLIWEAKETEFTAEEAMKAGLVRDVIGKKLFESAILTEKDKRHVIERWKKISFLTSLVIVSGVLINVFRIQWQAEEDWKNRPRIESGVVVSKRYEPEFEVPNLVIRNGWNESIINARRTAGYLITVEDGELREEWVVSKATYDKVDVGSRVRRKKKETEQDK